MNEQYQPLAEKTLPKAPSPGRALGVGIIAMGLAIGTGELILWPHLITKFGLGLLWAALAGITFQYFINQEVARHSLATGESFFTSSARIWKWFAPLWFLAAIVLYIWPGWAAAMGTTLKTLFGFGNYIGWALVTLGLVLLLTFSGRRAYAVLEYSLKIIVPVFFILLVISSVAVLRPGDLVEGFRGLLNFGWLPEGINFNTLMGAIVFAGAGGLLNLCLSLWYRDKQAGMGAYAGRIENPITGKPQATAVTGAVFPLTTENLAEWRRWMRYIMIDQGVIFWLLGLITLVLLSLNAHAVLTPRGLVPEGLDVAVVQAHIFEAVAGKFGFYLFLTMAFLMLFSVMWTVIDAMTRITSDILYTNAQHGPWRTRLGWLSRLSVSQLYYALIVAFVVTGGLLLPLKQPLALLTLSAVLGGVSMAIYTPLLVYMNNTRLPGPLRPGWFTNIFMVAASVFYLCFSVYLIYNLF